MEPDSLVNVDARRNVSCLLCDEEDSYMLGRKEESVLFLCSK
jgi:hypothetical protein